MQLFFHWVKYTSNKFYLYTFVPEKTKKHFFYSIKSSIISWQYKSTSSLSFPSNSSRYSDASVHTEWSCSHICSARVVRGKSTLSTPTLISGKNEEVVAPEKIYTLTYDFVFFSLVNFTFQFITL